MDFREAWVCSDRSESSGIRVHAMRILDKYGRQLRASVQWFAPGENADELRLWGIADVEGAAHPEVFREIDVSSDTNQNNPEAPTWSLRLANRAEPRRGLNLPFSEAPIGARLGWPQVRSHVRLESPARLTLTDQRGAILARREISASWLNQLEQRLRVAMRRTKLLARTSDTSCDPITEWMRL